MFSFVQTFASTGPPPGTAPRLRVTAIWRIWTLIGSTIAGIGVAVAVIAWQLPETMRAGTIDSAYYAALEAAEQLRVTRAYYTDAVLAKVRDHKDFTLTHEHKSSAAGLPIPASFVKDVSEALRQRNIGIDLVSPYPWPQRGTAALDAFESDAWEALKHDKSMIFRRQETHDGERWLRIGLADVLTRQTCVDCHNNHPQSVKRDWKLGDVRGIMQVRKNIEQPLQEAESRAKSIIGSLASAWLFTAAALLLAGFGMHRRTREKEKTQQRIEHLAFHDPVTGLGNWALLSERLQSFFSRPGLSQKCAVVCLDVAGFKEINEMLGHAAGDQILQCVGGRLEGLFKRPATVVRTNADEFVLLLPDEDDAGRIDALMGEIVSTLAEPIQTSAGPIAVKIVCGIAMAPRDGNSEDNLLKNADLALQNAKAEKKTWLHFEAAMNAERHRQLQLKNDLKKALERDEFAVHFQPVYDLATNRITAAEALLRWRHPQLGYVSPAIFIPIAETLRIIDEIGMWALAKACEEAMHWPARIDLAINLSPVQFRSPTLVQSIASVLSKSGFPAKRLELEVTETALIHDEKIASEILQDLRASGIRVALDDFGTGFASLSYLHAFPFDNLKIDRRFTGDVARSQSRGAAIFGSAVALAHTLSMETTAEGIETPEQLERVCSAGCKRGQGFLLSKPLPAEEMAKLLAAEASVGACTPATEQAA